LAKYSTAGQILKGQYPIKSPGKMFCFSHFAVIRTKGEVGITWKVVLALDKVPAETLMWHEIHDLSALLIILLISD